MTVTRHNEKKRGNDHEDFILKCTFVWVLVCL